MALHATYANARATDGTRHTFRVGRPLTWGRAQDRHARLLDILSPVAKRRWGGGYDHADARAFRLRFDRRVYSVESFEVRSVDPYGRGLGSERHTLAQTVPFRALRVA